MALSAGLRTFAHLSAAATFTALVLRQHRALAAGTACHLAILFLRRHCASLAILALTAIAILAASSIFAAAGSVLAATRHLAVCLAMIAACTAFGAVASSWTCLSCALGHQRQGHDERA